ncbi:hypothetical protein ACR75N_04725 [Parabacteroides merdae]|uniref:hypothetical protein n=1 Tax=Parabacteroides merdae TaxID=46503 RepID=UPI003DA32E81
MQSQQQTRKNKVSVQFNRRQQRAVKAREKAQEVVNIYDEYQQRVQARKEAVDSVFKEHRALVIASTYNILFSIKIAANAVYNLPESLAEDGLFKQNIKSKTKALINAVKSFERTTYSAYGDKAKFLEESVGRIVEEIGLDVEKIFWSIKQFLDKNRIDKTSALSRVEQARTLISLSIKIHEARIRKLQAINPDLPSMAYLRMDKPLMFIDDLSRDLCRNIIAGKTINLNDDTNCRLSVAVLDQKIADDERIARAIELTL